MGLTTVITINNDYLHEIDQDVERWWKEVYAAIQGMKKGRLSSGTRVISVTHSNETTVTATGGGSAEVLGVVPGHSVYPANSAERVREILGDVAKRNGYYLGKRNAKARRTRQALEQD